MTGKILTHNLGYKVLALVLAVILWVAVLNAEDPVITRDITSVPVTELNAQVITDAGKAYSFVDGKNTVDVIVSGRTSIVNRVTRDDITATVDLSKLSEVTGAVPVDVSCEKYPSLDVSTEGSEGILRVEIEDLAQKSLNIQVETTGSVSNDKYIGEGTATPNMVTISGPESVVNEVSSAIVEVPVSSGNETDITTTANIKLVDSDGDTVDSTSLTMTATSANVTIPIYNTKTVPLKLSFTGDPGGNYEVISTQYEPQEVTIAGPDDELDKVDSITLKDYDISGKTDKVEDSIVIMDDLSTSLPENVTLTDSTLTVAIAVDIEEMDETSLDLPVDQITLSGKSRKLKYSISGEDGVSDTVTLKVKGIKSELSSLDVSSLSGTVNVDGLSEGKYNLPVDVSLGDNFTLENKPRVYVTVSSKNQSSDETG